MGNSHEIAALAKQVWPTQKQIVVLISDGGVLVTDGDQCSALFLAADTADPVRAAKDYFIAESLLGELGEGGNFDTSILLQED